MSDQELIDGLNAVRDGRYREAISLLAEGSISEATLTDAQEVDRLFHLGVAYHEENKPEESAKCYERALDIDKDHIPSLSNLAGYYVNRDLHSNAQILYHRLFELDPSNAVHPYNFGLLFYKYAKSPQQFNNVASCFSHAIKLESTFVDAFEGRAICALRAGKLQEAGEDLLFLLFSAPGWRDNISDNMKQVMSLVWGDEQAQRHLDISSYAPRPVERIFALAGESQAPSDSFRGMILDQALKARKALSDDAATGGPPLAKGLYGVVAEEEFGDGLAGCQVDEYATGDDRWIVSIPVPLIEFLHLMVLLIDRPVPRDGTASSENATTYWRLRGFPPDEVVEVQRNLSAVDETGEAWSDEFRHFLADHGRELFSAIISLKSTGEERRAAISTVGLRLPGYQSRSEAEFRAWQSRLTMTTALPTLFVLHHEWAHVSSKHRIVKRGFVDSPDRERAFLWCSELVADRHAMISLLRLTFNIDRGPYHQDFVSLANGVAILMTVVEIQQRCQTDEGSAPAYPPAALRMSNLRAIVGERDGFGLAWDTLMYDYMARALAVAKACHWPELEAAVRSLFLEPIADDITVLNQTWNEVFTKTIEAGGRPLMVGNDPDSQLVS